LNTYLEANSFHSLYIVLLFHLSSGKHKTHFKSTLCTGKDPNYKKQMMVGLAGFEPTTFTRKQRLAAPTGFSKTAPELRHPTRSANPLLAFWSPSS
jgi:hypothetical protein